MCHVIGGSAKCWSRNAVLILPHKMALSMTFPPCYALPVVTSPTPMQSMFRACVRDGKCFYRLQFDGNELWKFC